MTVDLRTIASRANPSATYAESIREICTVLETLSTAQWDLPTPCPGWTIADIVAHVIDLDAMTLGAPKPDHQPDWEALPHVQGASNQFTELGVDYRRGTPPEQLLKELQDTATALVEFLANNSSTIKVPWVKNEISTDRFFSMRTFDTWTHEQDIRTAINAPGNLGTNSARAAAQRMISSTPMIWGKKVGAPAGSALTLTLSGPEIEGSAHILMNSEGVAEFVDSPVVGAYSVTMSWPGFTNAFTGRVPVSQSLATANMSGDLAVEFVSQLPSTP